MRTSFIDITGKRFGRWTVIKHTPRNPGEKAGQSRWQCKCDCGKIKDTVQYGGLVKGRSQSCGCLRREIFFNPNRDEVHGQSNPLYVVWMSMRTRCYNLKHHSSKQYGRRGVRVCQRWLDSFDNFAKDMGPRPSPDHSLVRKNNDGHYTPLNCVWATRQAQANNRRSNLRHTWHGEVMNLTQVARLENVEYAELRRQTHTLGTPLGEAVAMLKAANRQYHERAACMGATGRSKTGRTRKRWVAKGRFVHLMPEIVHTFPPDPIADIW